MNRSGLLTAPLKPTSGTSLWHPSIIGFLPIYLMAKSHQSSTPPFLLQSSQFKHLTASGNVQFKLFSLRTSLKCSVNWQHENIPRRHISVLYKKKKKNRVLGGKHSEPLVKQNVWKSQKKQCYWFLFVFWKKTNLLVLVLENKVPWRLSATWTWTCCAHFLLSSIFIRKQHSRNISIFKWLCANKHILLFALLVFLHYKRQMAARSSEILNFWLWT